MRIALDGTPLLGARTGVARVVDGLLHGLCARDDVEVVCYAVSGRRTLDGMLPDGVTTARSRLPARLVRELWMRADVPRIEHWTGAVDLVHATNYVAPPARVPALVSVYDLTFVHFPEMCTSDTLRYPRLVRRALARGAHIHVTSEFVRREVIDRLRADEQRVTCVYPGLAPVADGDPARGRVLAGAERYVLALGTVEPRKNLPRLVRAFDAVAAARADVVLVVAGPDGWGSDAFASAVDASPSRSRIRRLGYVPDPDRRDLLAGAAVFAYPSVYEGFGFPPLEAMAAGTAVVAGAAGSLPEVLGDAARLVDPLDVDAIAGALDALLTDDATRDELVERGRARADRYTWRRAVDEMVALYGSLL